MCFLGNTKGTSKFNLHCIECRNLRAAAAWCGGPLTAFEETAYPELAESRLLWNGENHLAKYVGRSWRANNISHLHQLRLTVIINKLSKWSTIISLDVVSHEISTVGWLPSRNKRTSYWSTVVTFSQQTYKLLERSGYSLATNVQVTGTQWLLCRNKRTRYWRAVVNLSQQAHKLLKRSGYSVATNVQVTGAQWLLSRNKRTSY